MVLLFQSELVVGRKGVVYLFMMFSWDKVTPHYEDGVLNSLSLGRRLWLHKALVPKIHRQAVQALLDAS